MTDQNEKIARLETDMATLETYSANQAETIAQLEAENEELRKENLSLCDGINGFVEWFNSKIHLTKKWAKEIKGAYGCGEKSGRIRAYEHSRDVFKATFNNIIEGSAGGKSVAIRTRGEGTGQPISCEKVGRLEKPKPAEPKPRCGNCDSSNLLWRENTAICQKCGKEGIPIGTKKGDEKR